MRAAIDWHALHPEELIPDVASRFGVNLGSLRSQMHRERHLSTTGKTTTQVEQERVVAKSKLISLGRPPVLHKPTSVSGDQELSQLVKDAMVVRLRRLGDPEVVAKETPEVFRENTLLLLERFELVQAVQTGKPRQKTSASSTYTAALLGELPPSSDSEDGDARAQGNGG